MRKRDALKILETLTTVDHAPNGVQGHVTKKTMPNNVEVILPIMALDFGFSTGCTGMDMKQAASGHNRGIDSNRIDSAFAE